MKAEQPWFPRDCDEAVKVCVMNTEQSFVSPGSSQAKKEKERAMPVFGGFRGPPAASDISFHASAADAVSKTSPSSRERNPNSLQVVSPSQFLSISSKSNLSLPLSQSEHCRTGSEHGPPSMACTQASTSGSNQEPRFFHSTHPTHKYQPMNGDNIVQDIAGCDKQSAARSPFRTETSNNYPEQNSFVPTLSASLPNLHAQTQRNAWLDHIDHTVRSGVFQRLAPQNIDLDFPGSDQVPPPQQDPSSYARTPQPGSARRRGPRRTISTMCQAYYKSHPSWCAQLMKLCGPSIPSPPSSHFSLETTLSTWSGLKTPASSVTTPSSTHSKYKTGSPGHLKMCAPECTWDGMYYHSQSQEYLDAAVVPGLTSPEQMYIPAVPMGATRQHQMRPLPPPRRQREEIYSPPELYSPNQMDFESISESIAATLAPDPNIGVEYVEHDDQNSMIGERLWPEVPADQNFLLPLTAWDSLSTAPNDIISEDDNAWNDIMADFPTSSEDCPPNYNAVSRNMYLPGEISNAGVASAGGTGASHIAVVEQGGALTAHQDVCTLVNRCSLCASLNYFERWDVHPALGQQEQLPNLTEWQRDSGPQNSLLADLVSESEPLGWDDTNRRGGPSRWGAIGEPVAIQPRMYGVQELRGTEGMRT